MRPTERTPETRPAERLFTKRELLVTTWDQRFAMSPADQVRFSYARTMLRLQLHNDGRNFDMAGASRILSHELADDDCSPLNRRRKPLHYGPN